jgi:hypothetical protein
LLVVTHDAAQPERMLLLTKPSVMVKAGAGLALAIPGSAGVATRDAHVIISAFEGDRAPSLTGDRVTLNGADVVAGGNAFAGRIGGVHSPQFDNNFGVDVLDATAVDVGTESLTLNVDTTNDRVVVAVIGIALDLA